MRHSTRITSFLIAVLAITATSCYTQLKSTYSSYPASGYYSSDSDRVASGDRSLDERSDEVVNEEDYTLGYDDGWMDAEAYYFKDYEAKRWYEEYGAALAHDPYVRHYTVNHHWYGRGFSPYHSYYYPHYPYYSHAYWSSRWTFSLGFHVGWNHWYPHYSYNPYYDYYAYPGYYPYYGGYWGWGYGGPFYGNTYVIYNGSRGTSRKYGPRNNGLTSRGSDITRRTRSDARVRNTANRSDIRSNARSRNVSENRSRGTVNRSSGTARSRSSSTVRSRSGSSNSRGTVNRGSSSNRSRSSGTVNRSRSSSNRSNGTVNRSRSSNRGNETVNRNRSSNQTRSNVGSEGVIISRGNSIITNRDNDHRRSAINNRSSDTNTRINRSSSVNNRIQDYNNQRDRSRIESNRPQTRRERSLNSLRSRLLDQKAESPNQHYTPPSRSRSSSIFNNRVVRDVVNSALGTSRSNNSSRSSSYGRSSSSNNRSSSVSRSRSSNSSRSTVRSSRSSSSSKSRGSSGSRSRSSSSRDRN